MKTISSITSILKIVVKYGALITVIVKVVQYAIDEIDALNLDKNQSRTEPLKEVNE
jgi:hypothetical protein